MTRQLKTQNKGRNTIDVKVTLKPQEAKLLDVAIFLDGSGLTRAGFLKKCATEKIENTRLGDIKWWDTI